MSSLGLAAVLCHMRAEIDQNKIASACSECMRWDPAIRHASACVHWESEVRALAAAGVKRPFVQRSSCISMAGFSYIVPDAEGRTPQDGRTATPPSLLALQEVMEAQCFLTLEPLSNMCSDFLVVVAMFFGFLHGLSTCPTFYATAKLSLSKPLLSLRSFTSEYRWLWGFAEEGEEVAADPSHGGTDNSTEKEDVILNK